MQITVRRPKRLVGEITPPGDKSISHRAAIFNAIADGEARVDNFGPGADCQATLRILRALGAGIATSGSSFTVRGGVPHEPADVLNAGNSGTTTRLMAGVLAGQPFMSVMSGDRSIRSRPMGRIVEPLRQMGAVIDGRGGGNLAPLAFRGGSLRGIRYRMPVASAQVKSALLLAGLFADGETVLDQPALSRDHTELMFRAMGVEVWEDGLTVAVRPGRLKAMDVTVPADISSAAYWLVAGVCHPDAEVRVVGVGTNPSRTGVLDVLQAMGADVSVENERTEGGERVADLVARSSELRATEIAGDLIPRLIDEVPVLALAACFAKGTTVVTRRIGAPREGVRPHQDDGPGADAPRGHCGGDGGRHAHHRRPAVARRRGPEPRRPPDRHDCRHRRTARDGTHDRQRRRVRLCLVSDVLGRDTRARRGRREVVSGGSPGGGPLLVVLSGPSGVGKDAVLIELRRTHPELFISVTATTRPQRPGEVDGLDYIFLTVQTDSSRCSSAASSSNTPWCTGAATAARRRLCGTLSPTAAMRSSRSTSRARRASGGSRPTRC